MGKIGPRRAQPTTAPADEAEGVRADRLARERQELDQAQASAAVGRAVDLAAVEAWVESWDTANELPMPRPGR
jgi:predicted transcriptional regulator